LELSLSFATPPSAKREEKAKGWWKDQMNPQRPRFLKPKDASSIPFADLRFEAERHILIATLAKLQSPCAVLGIADGGTQPFRIAPLFRTLRSARARGIL